MNEVLSRRIWLREGTYRNDYITEYRVLNNKISGNSIEMTIGE